MYSPGPSASHDRHPDSPIKKSKKSRSRIFFRRLVLFLGVLAVLVLWQLRFVITELGNLQHELETWKTARTVLATLLSYIVAHIIQFGHHLWTNIFR